MKTYAITSWCVADVRTLRPTWTDAQCEQFLERNASRIVDAMVEAGWFAIAARLDEDGGCACGNFLHPTKECVCTASEVRAYRAGRTA